jgi:hypothetical protein
MATERRRSVIVAQPEPSITIHFDGPITVDHSISIRTLGKTLDHLQNAIDRSYLDIKYGNVFKHQRLKKVEYADVDFLARPPRDGGFILDMVSETGREIIDRLNSAIEGAYDADVEDAEDEHSRLIDQAFMRQRVYRTNGRATRFDRYVAREEGNLARAYGDRSIAKEIDQVLSQLRADRYEGSTLELSMYGSRAHPVYEFDADKAVTFHRVVSDRRLGDPILVRVELRSLDAGRGGQASTGKCRNTDTGREFNIMIPEAALFDQLARHLTRRRRRILEVVACPIFEYNSYDPNAGDMVLIDFVGLADA